MKEITLHDAPQTARLIPPLQDQYQEVIEKYQQEQIKYSAKLVVFLFLCLMNVMQVVTHP